MRAIFLADGKVFTTGFSRMSERQLALWDPVSGPGWPDGLETWLPWARGVGVTRERPVVPWFSAQHLMLSGPRALPASAFPAPLLSGLPYGSSYLRVSVHIVLTKWRVFPSFAGLLLPSAEAPPPGSLPALPLKGSVHSCTSVSGSPGAPETG